MSKVIASFNMTLDGNCDHTAGLPDEEIHDHYTELLQQGSAILYGRTTYQLMEFWRTVLENPSEEKSMQDFARAIDRIPKIIFSRTLQHTDWQSASLATQDLHSTVSLLRKEMEKPIFVGSRSLIIQLMNLRLIDELQLCIHPVIAGKGLTLFDSIADRTVLRLMKTKTFKGGAVNLYYTLKP